MEHFAKLTWTLTCPRCWGDETEPETSLATGPCVECEGLGVVSLDAHAIQAWSVYPVAEGQRGPSDRNAKRRFRDALDAHQKAYAWHYRD